MLRLANLVSGKFWRGDHNFKYAMKLRCQGKYSAVFSIMNEYGEIVLQVVTEGKEFSELVPHLEALWAQIKGEGLQACGLVHRLYVINAELTRNSVVVQSETLAMFEPLPLQHYCYYDAIVCTYILHIHMHNYVVLGIDSKWCVICAGA